MLHLLLAPALTLLAPAQDPGSAAPPGLVVISGGRTTIGASVEEIEDLVEEYPSEAGTKIRGLDGATPRHTRAVAPFHLGHTEVTNEQYAEFVDATGYRPPLEWGAEAVEGGRKAYWAQVKVALDEGLPKPGEYGPERWWEQNWQGKTWAVPEGDELRPVVYVEYADALAYCRWAGLRLPTEFEFQHAVRGKSKDPYPWGDAWEDGKFAATEECRRMSRSMEVGSFPAGSTKAGVQDLAGNVWEWTSSPYLAYPGHEKNEYRVPGRRKRITSPAPLWNGNQRVTVGGSFMTSKVAARCSVRRAAVRHESKSALGFRVAATPVPTRDMVEHVWNMDLRNADARPSGVTYDLEGVMGLERWRSRPGAEGAPEGYRVITGYDYLALVPHVELEQITDVSFRKASLIEPQHLGFLTLSMPAVEPALVAGTYLLAFRAEGDTRYDRSADEPEEDPWAELLDTTADNLVFIDATTGEVAAIQIVTDFGFRNTEGDAGFAIVDGPRGGDEPAGPGEQAQTSGPWLRVKGEVRTSRRRRVLPFTFELRMGPDFDLLES